MGAVVGLVGKGGGCKGEEVGMGNQGGSRTRSLVYTGHHSL